MRDSTHSRLVWSGEKVCWAARSSVLADLDVVVRRPSGDVRTVDARQEEVQAVEAAWRFQHASPRIKQFVGGRARRCGGETLCR